MQPDNKIMKITATIIKAQAAVCCILQQCLLMRQADFTPKAVKNKARCRRVLKQ